LDGSKWKLKSLILMISIYEVIIFFFSEVSMHKDSKKLANYHLYVGSRPRVEDCTVTPHGDEALHREPMGLHEGNLVRFSVFFHLDTCRKVEVWTP